MSLLLDPHVVVWAALEPARLGKKAQAMLTDEHHTLYVAAVTMLEIAKLAALKLNCA